MIKILGFILLAVAAVALGGVIFQLLWNWVVVDIFSAPVVTFWQSIGLMLLSSLITARVNIGK